MATSAPSRTQHVEPEAGTRVLSPEVARRGSFRFAPIAVPDRYQVTFACVGGVLLLRVDSEHQGEYPCNSSDPTHVQLDRPPGQTTVVVEVAADQDTTWVLLVSTAASPPR